MFVSSEHVSRAEQLKHCGVVENSILNLKVFPLASVKTSTSVVASQEEAPADSTVVVLWPVYLFVSCLWAFLGKVIHWSVL